ncbi:DUF4282 domain-containing protein [Actinoallomurus iriomotensis]|uniref:DUF4282 domain-containing protein n=1 Tax=Actinoallomurus iriomotensis TaxID=478107 RepID=A0A9W6RT30_9ACTN|nr:hypothetical protein Airi01_103130 [Actinoallomurus iriomotensis]
MQPRKGFFMTLFDVEFKDEYITSKLVRGSYRIIIAFTSITVCFWLLVAWELPSWFGWGIKLAITIFAPTAGIFFLALTRMALEYIIVIFSINDKLGYLVHSEEEKKINSRKN